MAVVQRDGGEGGDEAGAAEELGDEDGGVGLRLRTVDPLDAWPQHAGVAATLAQHAATVAAHPLPINSVQPLKSIGGSYMYI